MAADGYNPAFYEMWASDQPRGDEHFITSALMNLVFVHSPVGFPRSNISFAADVLMLTDGLGGGKLTRLYDLLGPTYSHVSGSVALRTSWALFHAVISKMLMAKGLPDPIQEVAEAMGMSAPSGGRDLGLGQRDHVQVYYKATTDADFVKFTKPGDSAALMRPTHTASLPVVLYPEHGAKKAKAQFESLAVFLIGSILRATDTIDLRGFTTLFLRWYQVNSRNVDYFSHILTADFMVQDLCVQVPAEMMGVDTMTSVLRSVVLDYHPTALTVPLVMATASRPPGQNSAVLTCTPADNISSRGAMAQKVLEFGMPAIRGMSRTVRLVTTNAGREVMRDVELALMNPGDDPALFVLSDMLNYCVTLPHPASGGFGFYPIVYFGPSDGSVLASSTPMAHISLCQGIAAAIRAINRPLEHMVRTVQMQLMARNAKRLHDVSVELNPNWLHLVPFHLRRSLAVGLMGSHSGHRGRANYTERAIVDYLGFQKLGGVIQSDYLVASAQRPPIPGTPAPDHRGFMFSKFLGTQSPATYMHPVSTPAGYPPHPPESTQNVLEGMLRALVRMLFIDIVFAHTGGTALSEYWSMSPDDANALVDKFGPAIQTKGYKSGAIDEVLVAFLGVIILGQTHDPAIADKVSPRDSILVSIYGSTDNKTQVHTPPDPIAARLVVQKVVAVFLHIFTRS